MFSYDFLTDEHREIQAMARQFAQDQIAPIAEHFDHTGEFPMETVKKWGNWGSWELRFRWIMMGLRWTPSLMRS